MRQIFFLLLRKGEIEEIKKTAEILKVSYKIIDAQIRFENEINITTEAEKKREAFKKIYQVDEYLYKDKKVYLAIAQCCDFFNLLYDENCKEICAPTGGFTGKGDGKCPDFEKEAKLIKTIWKEKSE